jgi:hypothetical protein
MEVLAYASLHLQSLKVLDFPSWAPDWYLISTRGCTWLITAYNEYNACGGLEPSEPPQLQHKILHCSGILYDRVNGMEAVGGEFFRDYEFLVKIGTLMNESYENVPGLTKLQALILIFHRGQGPDYTRLEVNSESWPQATATFVHLLSDLCDTVKPQSTAQKKREMLNDSLRLRGMSIHNMCFRGSDQTATAILEQVSKIHRKSEKLLTTTLGRAFSLQGPCACIDGAPCESTDVLYSKGIRWFRCPRNSGRRYSCNYSRLQSPIDTSRTWFSLHNCRTLLCSRNYGWRGCCRNEK